MKVSEVMVRDVLTAEPGTELRRVAAMMIEKDVSGIPVVDGQGRLLGLVGELDLVQRHTRLEPPAFFPVLDARIPLETPSHYEHRHGAHVCLARSVDWSHVCVPAPG